MASIVILGTAKRPNTPPIARSPIVISPLTGAHQVSAGDLTPKVETVTVVAADGFAALQGITFTVPTQPWLTCVEVSPGVYTVTTTPTGFSHAQQSGGVTFNAANALQPESLSRTLTESAVALPAVGVSQLAGVDFDSVEGVTGQTPSQVLIAVSNIGQGSLINLTGTVTPLALSGHVDLFLDTTVAPAVLRVVPDAALIAATLGDGSYPYQITVNGTGAGGTPAATPAVITGTLRVAPAPVGKLWPAAPVGHLFPDGTLYDRTVNRVTGNPITAGQRWVDPGMCPTDTKDLDTVPDSQGRVMGANNVTNQLIVQRWLNDDGAGAVVVVGDVLNQPRRRVYTCLARTCDGTITTPHNPAPGYSTFKPTGYTFDPNLTTPRKQGDAAPGFTFRTTGNDAAAFQTSLNGQADNNHGGLAFLACHFTGDANRGPSHNSHNVGILRFGFTHNPANQSQAPNQNSFAKEPHRLFMWDTALYGVAGRFMRRGLEYHGKDCEIGLCAFSEIHNNFVNDTQTGNSNSSGDAQPFIAWNGTGNIWVRRSIFHGGDEPFHIGGAAPDIPGQNMQNILFEDNMCCVTEAFLNGGNPGVDSPYNQDNTYQWLHKNRGEFKNGYKQVYQYNVRSGCKLWNNNQGYGMTMKIGAYRGDELSAHITVLGEWIERHPGMFAFLPHENLAGPNVLNNVWCRDIFGWNINVAPHNQPNKRAMASVGSSAMILGKVTLEHISLLTTSPSTDGVLNFTPLNTAVPPTAGGVSEFHWRYSLVTYLGSLINGTGTSGQSSWNAAVQAGSLTGIKVIKPTALPNVASHTYAQFGAEIERFADFAACGVTNQATGNLRLNATVGGNPNPLYNTSPDGQWCYGVCDPDQVIDALEARVPDWRGGAWAANNAW